MKAKNFRIDDSIYIVTEGHSFDLHNNYDFCGFAFDVVQRSLVLSWEKTKGDWGQAADPPTVALRIHGVRSLEVTPRDPKTPFSEDDCLQDISFVCDEPWCSEPFAIEKIPDASWRWVFQFMSRASIVIDGDEIEVITKPEQRVAPV